MNNYDNTSVQGQNVGIEDRPIFYYATLVPGVPFDDNAEKAIEKAIRDNADLIFNFDPIGRHKANVIGSKELLGRICNTN